MEPQHIPDVELFIVLKWMLVVILAAGLAQYASLWVKRKWYGGEKHDRRDDTGDTRGWIERFLQNQREYTIAMVDLNINMGKILSALEANGKSIEGFTKSAECKFEGHGGSYGKTARG